MNHYADSREKLDHLPSENGLDDGGGLQEP